MATGKPRTYPKAYPTPPKAYPKPPMSFPITPAPKQPATSRELSTEEKASRYDEFVRLKAAKRATRQQIARLNRQLEQLELEENKVLENDPAEYSTSKNLPLGRCTQCGYEICQCEDLG